MNQFFAAATTRHLSVALILLSTATSLFAQRQMEKLGRGVVALHSATSQAYVGWRLLATDPADVGFNLYRSANGAAGVKLNSLPLTNTTDFVDSSASFTVSNAWYVVPVTNGVESTPSAACGLAANSPVRQYIPLPLSPVIGGAFPPYDVKFCWVGDLDGDGEYDFVVDRLSTLGATNQYLQAYKRDGTLLWQMDMGYNSVNQYNIEPGASAISVGHGDCVTVYDLDGDGKAEVCVRTARGVVLPNGSTISGPDDTTQYLSILDGLSGNELARTTITNMWPADGPMNGHFGIMYCDGVHPSVLLHMENRNASQAFQRETMTYDYRNGQLTRRWFHTPANGANESWGHQIRIMDVNHDGIDDLMNVGSALNGVNGQPLFDTELIHGDRFHVTDIDPDRPGLEMFSIQQNNSSLLATAFIDMGTGGIIKKWYAAGIVDVGRGTAFEMDPAHRGLEFYSTQPGIFDCKGNQIYANSIWPPEAIWWDADLARELEDGAGSGALNPVINKFNPATGGVDRLFNVYKDDGDYSSHQAYGGRAAFWGDILGDWREEFIVVQSDYAALRIYTTKIAAANRLYCLMQNPSYRVQATCKGYYQAGYVDYFLANDMPPPPVPPVSDAKLVWHGDGVNVWDANTTANWRTNWFYAGNANTNPAPFNAGDTVLFDLTGSNNAAITLAGTLTPGDVRVHAPKNFTFDSSNVTLAGVMKLTKGGAGSLTLNGTNSFTGATLVSEGALIVNGALPNSPVTVRGGVWLDGRLGGTGVVGSAVSFNEGAGVSPGQGTNSPGTLTIANNVTLNGRTLHDFDLSDDPTGTVKTNDLLNIVGNLNVPGALNTLVIRRLDASLPPGVYPLINYSGTFTGSLNYFSVSGLAGIPVTLTNPPGQIALVVKSYRAPASLTWNSLGGGAWDLLTASNWLNGATRDVFAPNDSVRFDNNGKLHPVVSLLDTLICSNVVVDSTNDYQLNGSGSITGATGLTKTNSGTLTISALNNSFTGKTFLSGGTLAVSELDAVGYASPLGNPPGGSTNLVFSGSPTLRILGESYTDRGMTLNAGTNTIDVTNSTDQLTVAGVITGSGALKKVGGGALALSVNNAFTGPTFIYGGGISLGGGTANQYALGPGPGGNGNTTITISNASLQMFSDSGSYDTCYWNLIVPTNSTATIYADDRVNLYGTLTGGGTLNFNVYYTRTELDGNWSGFTGQINVSTDSAGGDFRIGNSSGYANASVNFANYVSAYHITGGTAVSLGAVSGGALAKMSGVAWTVGTKNTDATFAGNISGNSITKAGTGAWTLTGSNYFTGATTVSTGTLFVNGDNHSASGNVTVSSGATLGGGGVIGGATTVNGKISPGSTNGVIGTLTISNNVTIAASGTAFFEINRTAGTKDYINASGTVTYGGTLQVTNLAGTFANNDSYKIFNGAAYAGTFANKILPALSAGLAWDTSSLITNGTIKVVLSTTLPPVPAAPTNLVAIAVSYSQINLTWADASTNEDNFLIEQSLDGTNFSQIAAVGPGVTAFANSNLFGSTTYYYRVRASNLGGNSPYSNIASTTTPAPPVSLVWRGDGAANAWDINTTANWRSNGVATVFTDGSAVVFDDSGSNNVSVNLSAAVSPGSVTVSATKNYTFGGAGLLAGSSALLKTGAGMLSLGNSNSYTGGTLISGGTVTLTSDTANRYAFGTGDIVLSNATLTMNNNYSSFNTNVWDIVVPNNAIATLNADARCDLGGSLSGGGTLNFVIPNNRTTIFGDWSAFTGVINAQPSPSGGGDFRIGPSYSWPGVPNAALNLGTNIYATWTGNLNSDGTSFCNIGELSGVSSAQLANSSSSGRNLTYRIGGRNTDATYAGRLTDGSGPILITKVGGGTWILSGTNTYSGTTTISSGTLQFGDGGTAGTLPTNNIINNATLVFNRANGLADAGIISGPGTVVQDGDGATTFTRVHTYSGPTLINSGTLALSGSGNCSNSAAFNVALGATFDVSARTGGGWTLPGGKSLTGNGAVNGNLIVASGAKLAPGNSIGTLTFSNNLTLAAGSTNTFEVSGTPMSADKLKVLGTLACGGNLIVTNIGGALAAGDTFKVFDAAVISGGFSSVTLPVLTGNLFWNTNNLLVDGTLTVAAPTPPVIGAIALAGNKLVFTGTGGTAGANYYLVGTTNLALPAASWVRLLTNQFGTGGTFNCTNTPGPGWPQGYYRLLVP